MRDDTTKVCNELSRKGRTGREKAGVYKRPGSALADTFADGLPVQSDFPSFPLCNLGSSIIPYHVTDRANGPAQITWPKTIDCRRRNVEAQELGNILDRPFINLLIETFRGKEIYKTPACPLHVVISSGISTRKNFRDHVPLIFFDILCTVSRLLKQERNCLLNSGPVYMGGGCPGG